MINQWNPSAPFASNASSAPTKPASAGTSFATACVTSASLGRVALRDIIVVSDTLLTGIEYGTLYEM
jgi:hypothetical protein